MTTQYNHYFKPVNGLTHIDVYRVLTLFGVTDPAIAHAIKKLLVAGGRGAKDLNKDVAEAIVCLERWQQMRQEEQQQNAYFSLAKAPSEPPNAELLGPTKRHIEPSRPFEEQNPSALNSVPFNSAPPAQGARTERGHP